LNEDGGNGPTELEDHAGDMKPMTTQLAKSKPDSMKAASLWWLVVAAQFCFTGVAACNVSCQEPVHPSEDQTTALYNRIGKQNGPITESCNGCGMYPG
jgi:hypothetical protein